MSALRTTAVSHLKRGGVNKARSCPSENKENVEGTSGQEIYKYEPISDDDDCFIVGVAQRSPRPECYSMQNCPKSEPMSPDAKKSRKRKRQTPDIQPEAAVVKSTATLTTETTTMSVPVSVPAEVVVAPFTALTTTPSDSAITSEVTLPGKLFYRRLRTLFYVHGFNYYF